MQNDVEMVVQQITDQVESVNEEVNKVSTANDSFNTRSRMS